MPAYHQHVLILGLELHDRFDIGEMHSSADVVPGFQYSGREIMTKLTNALGKTPGKIFLLLSIPK